MTTSTSSPADSDPLAQPISAIEHAWPLKEGGMCLHVLCRDGVTREIILPRR